MKVLDSFNGKFIALNGAQDQPSDAGWLHLDRRNMWSTQQKVGEATGDCRFSFRNGIAVDDFGEFGLGGFDRCLNLPFSKSPCGATRWGWTPEKSADPSHLQGERAREKVALSILPHSGGSSLASNASRRLRRRLLLPSGSSVKCPAAPLPEAFAAFWTLSKSFSSGFRKQR